MEQHNKPKGQTPFAQFLTLQDVDSCVMLEDAAFLEPDQRCTREKVGTHLLSRYVLEEHGNIKRLCHLRPHQDLHPHL
jgi:hypothetical protein